MWRVIGKKKGLTGRAAEDADRLMGRDIGDALIGLLVLHAPDGLILQNGAECWETTCGARVVFDPARDDWTNLPGGYVKEPELTSREWREYIQEAAKSHARFMKLYEA